MKNRVKFTTVAFAINGFVFLLGGILLFEDEKPILAIIQWLAFLLNMAMILKIWKKSVIDRLNYSILIMNVVACISMAVDTYISGKSYIQYAWLLAALVSIIALLVQVKNGRLTKEKLYGES